MTKTTHIVVSMPMDLEWWFQSYRSGTVKDIEKWYPGKLNFSYCIVALKIVISHEIKLVEG